jgi:hypothetical protein
MESVAGYSVSDPGLFQENDDARLPSNCHLNYFHGLRFIPKFLWFPENGNLSIGPFMLTDKDNLLRRLHALRSEHRDLDTVIARITEHAPTDQLQVQRLKKRKLGLKDEIAWLESRLIPDRTA